MKAIKFLACMLLAMSILPSSSKADEVGDAYKVCAVFQNTGMASECEVKGWGSFIDVRIDTSGGEARKICAGVVDQLSAYTSFSEKWTLRIFSPFSGDHPLATCKLK